MGWKTINGRRYFYRSERVNGRVRTTYWGPESHGWLVAEIYASVQQERIRERMKEKLDRDEAAELGEQLDELVAGVTAEAHRLIEAAGYHRHKREWRKRRVKRTCQLCRVGN